MGHMCKAMPREPVSIDYEELGGWVLWALGYSVKINICPWCGLKLEPPDVKIEISEQALWDINKKLKSAQQLLWGHPRESSDLIYSVIEEITGAIHGNDCPRVLAHDTPSPGWHSGGDCKEVAHRLTQPNTGPHCTQSRPTNGRLGESPPV